MLDSLLLIEQVGEEKLNITQAALRNDKCLSPFIVRMNNLNPIRIDLEFVDFINEEEDKRDKANEDILTLLDETEEKLHQKEIINQLTTTGEYSGTTIKYALKALVDAKEISPESVGNKKYYKRLKTD